MIDTPNLTILDLRFSTVVRSSLLCSIAPVTRERGNKGVKKKDKQGRYSPLLISQHQLSSSLFIGRKQKDTTRQVRTDLGWARDPPILYQEGIAFGDAVQLARKAFLICGPASQSNEELISPLQHESHNQQIGTLIDHNDIVEMPH